MPWPSHNHGNRTDDGSDAQANADPEAKTAQQIVFIGWPMNRITQKEPAGFKPRAGERPCTWHDQVNRNSGFLSFLRKRYAVSTTQSAPATATLRPWASITPLRAETVATHHAAGDREGNVSTSRMCRLGVQHHAAWVHSPAPRLLALTIVLSHYTCGYWHPGRGCGPWLNACTLRMLLGWRESTMAVALGQDWRHGRNADPAGDGVDADRSRLGQRVQHPGALDLWHRRS